MNQDDLCFLSAVELAAAVRTKELTAVEVTEAVLERIERLNPALNAFCTSMAGEARVVGRVLFGDLVHSLLGLRPDDRDTILRSPASDSTSKPSGHGYQMVIVQRIVGAEQLSPPRAETAG